MLVYNLRSPCCSFVSNESWWYCRGWRNPGTAIRACRRKLSQSSLSSPCEGGKHRSQANKRGLSSRCSAQKLSSVFATETRSGWLGKTQSTVAPPSESQQDEDRRREKRADARGKSTYKYKSLIATPADHSCQPPAAVADQSSPYALYSQTSP